MSYITIRLPESQIKQLKQLATQRRVSMSTLFEEVCGNLLKEQNACQAGKPSGLLSSTIPAEATEVQEAS